MSVQLLTLYCWCSIAPHAAAIDENAKKGVGTQVSDKGFTLSLSLPEKAYAGSAIPLVVSVKNEGDKDAMYYKVTKWKDSHIEVVDSKGKQVPLTRFGKTVLGGDGEVLARVKKKLPAGKELKETINLARVFDLTVPGDYAISIERVFNQNIPGTPVTKVKISKFAFPVLEPLE